MSLPSFFAVACENGAYQVYEARLVDGDNELWPVRGIAVSDTRSVGPPGATHSAHVRKWNGQTTRTLKYAFSAFVVHAVKAKIYLNSDIPVITVYSENVLPINNFFANGAAAVRVTAAPVSSLPGHVKNILVKDMIDRKDVCAISQEEITLENSAVTSCGHVFVKSSIEHWLAMPVSKGCCALCKQPCCI